MKHSSEIETSTVDRLAEELPPPQVIHPSPSIETGVYSRSEQSGLADAVALFLIIALIVVLLIVFAF
jgi:hypothetical protein